ncbi:MAG: sulfur oxidation c-type cytochrome SoxX [Betaproteobacteria bacterium]
MNLAQRLWLATALAAVWVIVAPHPVRAEPKDNQKLATGARLAQETNKGNCLACHAMPSDPRAITSANIGPPLLSMKARFPDRERLRRQIWDAQSINSDTVMPPFGKNRILTGEEIDLVIDYLYTL